MTYTTSQRPNKNFNASSKNRMSARVKNWSNRTGYRGVQPIPTFPGKFKATLWHQRQPKHLGTFTSAEQAARAYDAAAKEFHGDAAILNFPEDK
jgi:hypothetical protein